MSSIFRIKFVEGAREWEVAKKIRQRVFVEEQNCPPEEEWDGFDAVSRHFLGMVGDEAVATARWRTVEWAHTRAAKLERFAVLPALRGRGYGRRMVGYLLADALAAGQQTCLLHAQAHLQPFYAAFGFKPVGPYFTEAGICHIKMVWVRPDGQRLLPRRPTSEAG